MSEMGYFERLLERGDLAAYIPFREVRLTGWEPKLNDCHGNVDHWVAHHPDTAAVRGWLFWGPNEAGQYIFMAHSVLEDNGQLFDITPLDQSTPRNDLRFLRHPGTEAEFFAMKTACSQSFYPPLTDDEWQGQTGALG